MVKFWYLTSALFVLNVTQFAMLSAQACSESGWFGSNCQYKCNCLHEDCNATTGECGVGSSCEYGWFGPACQYVDLTSTESNTTAPKWLYDGDDTNCIKNDDSEKVTVKLAEPFPFTWLRLHVRDKDDQNSIEVHFKDDLSRGDDNLVGCSKKKTSAVDEKSLDIHCDLGILVQQVILSGKGVMSLCSVHISGGRQVTLRQPTSQSTPAFSSNSEMGVDGYTSTESEFCTSTSSGDTNPNWNVTFEQPKAINRILLTYRQEENRYIKHILTFYDKNGKKLLERPWNKESTSVTYYTTEVRPVAPVSVINVKVSTAPPSHRPLILCEVQAYGDTVCPKGKYGRECEHTCDCKNNGCFGATGECQTHSADGGDSTGPSVAGVLSAPIIVLFFCFWN